jgi:hypothetical protein
MFFILWSKGGLVQTEWVQQLNLQIAVFFVYTNLQPSAVQT